MGFPIIALTSPITPQSKSRITASKYLSPPQPHCENPRDPVTVCSKPPQRFGVALNGVVFDPEDVAIWRETGPTCGGPNKEHTFFTFLHSCAALRVREKN